MKKHSVKVTRNEQVNILDVFLYLASNWFWFALAVVISLAIGYYRYSKINYRYTSTIVAILKNAGTGVRTVQMDNYERMINTVSMSNEDLVLHSRSLMADVVRAMDADVSYMEDIKNRNVELYRSLTPFRLVFARDTDDDPGLFHFTAVPQANHTLKLVSGDLGTGMVSLGDTLALGKGHVVLLPTDRYDQYIDHEIRVSRQAVDAVAAGFLGGLAISHEKDIITISETDWNAQRAADVVNTLIQKYNDNTIAEKNRVAIKTEEFIKNRLDVIEKDLDGIVGSLVHFQQDNQLMDVGEAASLYLQESRGYNQEIVQLETRIALAKYVKEYISGLDGSFMMIPSNTGLEDENIDATITQYNELVLRREKLVEASSTESPAVKQIELTLLSSRRNILDHVNNLLASLSIQRKDLDKREKEASEKFASMPPKQQEMLEIQRQQAIKESLYTFLLNKREENILTQAMADDNIRVVDPARANYTPSSPDRMRMLALAILIGLMIPAIALIARLFLDTKIRTRKEIEENIDVPFLAEIPLSEDLSNKIFSFRSPLKKAREVPLVYKAEAYDIFTEAMRLMCTNLSFVDPNRKPPMVIAMTSYTSNSGKSFISTNMAACLADSQKNVVLVDADLRKRSISDEFGLKHNTMGLSDYLHDPDIDLYQVVHINVSNGFDVIPAGSTPPNPGELFSRQRFDDLIQLLRERYDYIILDSVPVQFLSDPLVMNRVVDINLFILRSGQLDRRLLPQMEELHQSGRLTNMAIVFNGPQIKRRRGYGFGTYGYGYGYGYGYEHSYAYGEDENRKKKTWLQKLFKK